MLPAVTGMVATLTFDTGPDGGRGRRTASPSRPTSPSGWSGPGVPFREAHELAGVCVRACEERGIDLADLSDADLAAISPTLTPAVREVLTRGGVAAVPVRRTAAPPRPASASSSADLRAVVASPAWAGPAG